MYVFVLILVLCSCKQDEKLSIGASEIAIEEAISKEKEVAINEIIQGDIEYVQLEANKKCLLGNSIRLYANDSLIIAIAFRQMFLFDRSTGKFIREIGHYGRDPGGYRNTVYSFPYNEIKNTYYAQGWGSNQFEEYDKNGHLNKSNKAPVNTQSLAIFNDSTYVAYIGNYSGNEKTKLVIIDAKQNVIKKYPNYQEYPPSLNVTKWRSSWFYKFESDLLFFEQFS